VTPVSYRLGWATRGVDSPGVIAAVAAATSFALGALYMRASRDPSPLFAYWCSGVVTAALIGADFPGAGQPRWSEFELSLPVAPRERARARLLLSFGFWLLPLLSTLVLGQLGAFGEGQRLSGSLLFRSFSSAFMSVVLVIALRHTLGLGLTGFAAGALRVGMVAIIALGFAQHSPLATAAMLAVAAPLLGNAHRMAAHESELHLPRATTSTARAAQSTTFDRVALRYVLGSGYGAGLLVAALVWVLAIQTGWLPPVLSNGLFVLLWVVYHAAYSARLLRIGYLPVARERLFRFIAWPSLAALALGVGLSLVLPSPHERCRVQEEDGVITIHYPRRVWRLTTAEPPLVVAPNGERHQPFAHTIGLGSALVAYDPYEVPPQASDAFLVHQLGRLVADERGVALAPAELERRFRPLFMDVGAPSRETYVEIRDTQALRARLVSGAVFLVLGLLALHSVIRPGPALDARAWRRRPLPWMLVGLFLFGGLYQLMTGYWKRTIDPIAIVLSEVSRALADRLGLVLPIAVVLGLLLYRSLLERFLHMEAPPRAKAMDNWFVDI
jgi:hypothetical protein